MSLTRMSMHTSAEAIADHRTPCRFRRITMKPNIRRVAGLLGLAAGCQAHWVLAAVAPNTCVWAPGGSGTMTFIQDLGSVYVPRMFPPRHRITVPASPALKLLPEMPENVPLNNSRPLKVCGPGAIGPVLISVM